MEGSVCSESKGSGHLVLTPAPFLHLNEVADGGFLISAVHRLSPWLWVSFIPQDDPACRPYVTAPCTEGTAAGLGTSSRGTGELRAQRHRCRGSQRLRCQGNGHRAFRHGRSAKRLSWRKQAGALTPARPCIAPGTPCATCASGSHATPVPGPPNLMLSDNS